jgi:ATP-dependent DNA ligase
MKFRYPDDPGRISVEGLAQMEQDWPGYLLAQVKGDGWRRPAYIEEGQVTFYAKRGDGQEAATQPPQDLIDEFMDMGWPDGIALDMEWMGPRCVEVLKGRHEFWIFDMMYFEGKWLGRRTGFEARLRLLREVLSGLSMPPRVKLLETWSSDFVAHFDEQKQNPLSEGLVLRRKDSKLIGSNTSAKKNPGMMKVKYRDIKEKAGF